MKPTFLILTGLLFAGASQAAIKTLTSEYRQGDVVLEGFHAYDDSISGKRPS